MKSTESFFAKVLRLFVSLTLASAIKFIAPEIDPFSVIGLGLFINFGLSFYYKLGRDIPVKELVILIALIQWVIAPILSYHFYTKSEFYYMIIDESRYMSFVLPASAALIAGLLFPLRQSLELIQKPYIENPEYYFKRGKVIMIIGFVSLILKPFMPGSVAYFFLLMSYSSILGAFYLLKSNIRFKFIFVLAAFAPVFLGAAKSSVFHELFIWGGFFVIIYTYINKSNTFSKTLLLTFMVAGIFLINAVKKEYREVVWAEDYEQIKNQPQLPGQLNASGKSSTGQLIGMVNDKVSNTGIQSDFYQEFTDRLNQGWIIARIMYVVPEYQEFANGETIKNGLYASFLPRFLSPNKATSGGKENFERFTGLTLGGASMNLGIIGEAYANYGAGGGILFMFIYGLFFNIIYWIIVKRSHLKSEYLLWLPFLFFYVIKAEEDFTSIFNQFVKSVVVMTILFYMLDMFVTEKPLLQPKVESTF